MQVGLQLYHEQWSSEREDTSQNRFLGAVKRRTKCRGAPNNGTASVRCKIAQMCSRRNGKPWKNFFTKQPLFEAKQREVLGKGDLRTTVI